MLKRFTHFTPRLKGKHSVDAIPLV